MKKRFVALMLCLLLAGGTLVGCGSAAEETTSDDGGSKTAGLVEGDFTVGVSQFAEHGALDACREGFLAALADEGFVEDENLTVIYENAQADMGNANQIAQNFVTQGVDLMYAIATPSAQAAFNAATGTQIPTVFGAITDPIAAGLAEKDGSPAGEVTGVSDALPIEPQLEMIRELMPEAKTIGILYTTSEVNSESSIAEYEKLVGEYGFELEIVGVNTTADVPAAADALLSKVDCISNLTDNTIVSSMPTILDKANAKNIPVFGSEVAQVEIGCAASEGLEYTDLGYQAGMMAAKILKGEAKASDMPFEAVTETRLYLNDKALSDLGIEVPEATRSRAAEVFSEIKVD